MGSSHFSCFFHRRDKRMRRCPNNKTDSDRREEIFDKFPKLKVIVLEVGAGWIGYWLERMDAVFDSPLGKSVPLMDKPSEYFRRQCWISGDPDERSLAGVIPYVGEDRFFWASDFPHADHPPDYIPNLIQLTSLLSESARAGILGKNVLDCYGLNS